MCIFKIIFLLLLSITFGTRLGLAETTPASQRAEATISAAKVSAPSQTEKPAEMVLVREGEFYQIYRPLNEAEVKAAAEKEAARQAEIEAEKLRLVELLRAG